MKTNSRTGVRWLMLGVALLAMAPAVLMAGPAKVRRIVVFDGAALNEAARGPLVAKFGGVLVKPLPLVDGAAVLLPPGAVEALARQPGVLRVDEDVVVYALPKVSGKASKVRPPPQPSQTLPWGIDRIDAEWAWAYATGAGVRVAVIDTGIDAAHPDLAGAVAGGVNTISTRKSYADDNGHGTHVAGIIGARNNSIGVVGVAPDVSLYAVKALSASGSGYLSDIIEGLDWCIARGIQVANMSLGTNSNVLSFQQACDRARAAGVILVAAAGNDGAAVDYPGAYDSVIAVAATDAGDVTASWSSYGPEVDLAAPGVSVLSTYPGGGYRTLSGTSMAAPHVTGTIALNLAADLAAAADDLPPAGVDDDTGAGLVDAGESASGIPDYGNDLP